MQIAKLGISTLEPMIAGGGDSETLANGVAAMRAGRDVNIDVYPASCRPCKRALRQPGRGRIWRMREQCQQISASHGRSCCAVTPKADQSSGRGRRRGKSSLRSWILCFDRPLVHKDSKPATASSDLDWLSCATQDTKPSASSGIRRSLDG
jgi:hypothetical protein